MSIRSIGIVGGGSAGFLCGLALKRKLPHLEVTLIKSEQIPIIGVGEATTWSVPGFLHDYLGIAETLNLDRSPYLPRTGGEPQLAGPIGYHIENESFVGFLEKTAIAEGVRVLDRLIKEFPLAEDGSLAALALDDGSLVRFDLYIDCSGFRSRLLGGALGVPFVSYASSLFCDRAVVGGHARGDLPVKPYTGSATMSAGWSFVTEHWDRVNLGYVFSSKHIADADADRELRAFCGGRLDRTRIVPFTSGRYARAWEKTCGTAAHALSMEAAFEQLSGTPARAAG